ncbi:MAG: hypothetical protein WCJ57_01660 [Candidatus Falkowbacteria bacterium]
MNKIKLCEHPASKRTSVKRHSIDWDAFEKILHNLSQLEVNGTLTRADINNFKEDFLKNEIDTVVSFIEKSIEVKFSHACIYLMLFEVLKSLLIRDKIIKDKYTALCKELFEKRGDDISKFYNLDNIKRALASSI